MKPYSPFDDPPEYHESIAGTKAMTLPKIDSLSNEQIRAMCAEAMGWMRIEKTDIGFIGENPDENTRWLPDYPIDANAALTLCAWMADKNWWWETGNQWISETEQNAYCELVPKHGDSRPTRTRADTFAIAICRAFLIANHLAE